MEILIGGLYGNFFEKLMDVYDRRLHSEIKSWNVKSRLHTIITKGCRIKTLYGIYASVELYVKVSSCQLSCSSDEVFTYCAKFIVEYEKFMVSWASLNNFILSMKILWSHDWNANCFCTSLFWWLGLPTQCYDLFQWLSREISLLQNLIDQANEKGWRKEYPFVISFYCGLS